MADFGGMVLTDVGKNLQAVVQTGELLTFTKISLGDGVLTGSLEDYTELVSEQKTISPSSVTIPDPPDGTATVRGTLSNTGMESGFFVREIGLFAQDPDDEEAEILYAIAYAANPDYLPAAGGSTVVEQIIDLVVVVASASNITITIDGDYYLTENHNDDPTAHPAIRTEIDTDIATHNADPTAHGLDDFSFDEGIGIAIDAHDANATAHPAIRSEIVSDIATHNTDAWAHLAIREEIDTDIAIHNEDETAHGIPTQISAHNTDGDAHAGIVSGISAEIDGDVSAHNTNVAAHTAIQTKIGTDIASHNSSAAAHASLFAQVIHNSVMRWI